MSAAAPALAPDLVAALKRLKLSRVRALAPEVLATAKIQRWAPEEALRTLVEAEIAGRDEANQANRLRLVGFPVTKTLEQFERAHSSIASPRLDYLASLEWIAGAENLGLIGPAGTGKSHLLVALGHAAVAEGKRVRYLAAAEPVEALYRGMADNSAGRVIDGLLRHDLVIVDESASRPLMPPAHSCCFASWPPPMSAARSGSRARRLRGVRALPARAHHGRLAS